MKNKKFWSLILAFAMVFSMIAGCVPNDSAESSTTEATETTDTAPAATEQNGDEVVTLKWQSYDGFDKNEAVINAFEAAHPNIKIEYEQISDYQTKLLTEAASDDLPDLISCNTGTTQVLGDAGILKALDIEAIKADTAYNFDDLWETCATYCTYDGTWYALPIDGGDLAWAYNVKMFDQVGIVVPEDGFTWDEFEAACATLLANKDQLGITYPTALNDYSYSSIDLMFPFINQAGGSYLNADGTCAWNSPATVNAFNWVFGLIEKGYIPPIEKLDVGSNPLISMLNAGEIAMCRVELWNAGYLADSDKVEWRAMHAPKGNDGTQSEVLFLNGIAISSTTEHSNEALEFIKYVTSEEGLAIYLQGGSSAQIAVRRAQSALSVAMFDESKNMQVFNEALAYCSYINLTKTFSDQQATIGQYFDKIWYDKADVQTTLDEMTVKLNELLAQ